MTRRAGERGIAIAVEAAIVIPALLLFVGLLLTLARVAIADQHVGSAAAAAARAASLERTVGAAQRAAHATLASSLAEHNVACLSTELSVNATGVARTVGQQASVSVSLTCQVALSDVSLPLVPGSVSVSALRIAPVDPLRGR